MLNSGIEECSCDISCAVEEVLCHASIKHPIMKHSACLAATHTDYYSAGSVECTILLRSVDLVAGGVVLRF